MRKALCLLTWSHFASHFKSRGPLIILGEITQEGWHIDQGSHVMITVEIILKSSQISWWSPNRDLCRDLHRSGVRGWLRHRSQPLYSAVLTVHSVHLNTGSYIGGQRVNTNCNTNKIFSVQLSPRSHITKDLQRCNAAKRTHSPLNLNIHTTAGVSFK